MFNLKLGMWAGNLAGNGAESIPESQLMCTDLSKGKALLH